MYFEDKLDDVLHLVEARGRLKPATIVMKSGNTIPAHHVRMTRSQYGNDILVAGIGIGTVDVTPYYNYGRRDRVIYRMPDFVKFRGWVPSPYQDETGWDPGLAAEWRAKGVPEDQIPQHIKENDSYDARRRMHWEYQFLNIITMNPDNVEKIEWGFGPTHNEAAAPAAPPVKPHRPVKPDQPRPQEPRRKADPFRPPMPKHVPRPKPKNTRRIREDYDSESHPSTVGFWRDLRQNRSSTLAKHPIMALYGDDLSRSSWQHTKDRFDASESDLQQAMQYMQQVMMLEQRHTQDLIELAKDITVQIWGVPRELLNGMLTQDVEKNEESDQDFGEEVQIDPALLKQINKRITMNALTQGSAVHAMLSLHHAVDREINAIDERLLPLYNKLSALGHHQYWLIDIPAMFAMLGMSAAGSANVDYDDEGNPSIDARGVVFPILAQEMNKGVAELISHHGLANMQPGEAEQVLSKADDVRLEPYLIQIGPELWRRFLKVKPREIPLAEVVQALAVQEPDQLTNIIMAVVEDPNRAKELLLDLTSEPEDFDVTEY